MLLPYCGHVARADDSRQHVLLFRGEAVPAVLGVRRSQQYWADSPPRPEWRNASQGKTTRDVLEIPNTLSPQTETRYHGPHFHTVKKILSAT